MWLVSALAIVTGFVFLAFGAPAPGVFAFQWPADALVDPKSAHLAWGPALLGFGLAAALFAPRGEQRNAAAFAALVSGLAVAVVVAARGEAWAVRLALALIGFGLAAFLARREIVAALADPKPPIPWPAWLAIAAPVLLLGPALIGDPAPARHALALALGAGALVFAALALSEARAGQAFAFDLWSGGLGGGRGGFSLSRPLALMILALGLAGAAAVAVVGPEPPAADSAKKPEGQNGKGKTDGKTGEPEPGGASL